MTRYKTENRKAKVGERILITQPISTHGEYKKGDVLTVTEVHGNCIETNEMNVVVFHMEYRVIIEEADGMNPVDEQKAAVGRLSKMLGYIDLAKNVALEGPLYMPELKAIEGLDKVAEQIRDDIEAHTGHIARC